MPYLCQLGIACAKLQKAVKIPWFTQSAKGRMAERRRRRRICQEDRERLIRAFEEQEQDYLVLADTLGIKRSTARGIVSRYLRGNRIDERPRGGRNNVKFDDDMRQCLQEIVDENCTLTITAINSELQHRLPEKPNVHARTIAKHLEGMLYTFKLSRVLPADRNRPDLIDRRNEYAQWFLEVANLHHAVFIDECGFNIWSARNHGRSQRGDRAYRQVCGQKGRNITICLAISPVFGLVHHTIREGGMRRESFTEFLEQTSENLDENEIHYLIFDGAPAHRRPEEPSENVHVNILPPYSPFLNIVEQAISCLKANIKAELARPAMQERFADRNAARQAHLPLGEYRKRLLVESAERNIGCISVAKCAAWYRHMQSYLPRCLAREIIEG